MKRIVTILLLFCSFVAVGQFRLPTVNLRNGLVMHMKFEETSGTTAFDETNNNNDGNTSGATINQTGKVGKCYSYDGNNDRISIPSFTYVNNQQFSISIWFKVSVTKTHYLFGDRNDVTNNWNFFILTNTGVLGAFVKGNTQLVVTSTTTGLDDGAWHHGCCTYNGSGRFKLYLDGVEEADISGATIDWSATPIGVGNTIGTALSSNYTNGLIDECVIWSRELSSVEVKQLYYFGDGLIYVYENYLNDGDFEKFNNYAKQYFALNK